LRPIIQFSAITLSTFIILYGLKSAYDGALGDSQFLDGWLLCGGILMQLAFHFRKKQPRLAIGAASTWMQAHISIGFVVVIIFLFHTAGTLPDSLFEWMLWTAFMLVASSGFIGLYLSRVIPTGLSKKCEQVPYDAIPAARKQLAHAADELAMSASHLSGSQPIAEFYVETLFDFFKQPANIAAHLKNSNRPLTRICEQLDGYNRYLDEPGQEHLNSLRALVIRKNELDHQFAQKRLLRAWLFVHVPATYSLIIFSILHIIVIYSFSSGAPG